MSSKKSYLEAEIRKILQQLCSPEIRVKNKGADVWTTDRFMTAKTASTRTPSNELLIFSPIWSPSNFHSRYWTHSYVYTLLAGGDKYKRTCAQHIHRITMQLAYKINSEITEELNFYSSDDGDTSYIYLLYLPPKFFAFWTKFFKLI